MTNSADPDQLASSEANRSGSTMFAKTGHVVLSKRRVKKKNVCLDIVQDKHLYQVNIFLLRHENLCCGYSLEVPLEVPSQGTSNEYPQCLFSCRNKTTIFATWLKKLSMVKRGATILTIFEIAYPHNMK